MRTIHPEKQQNKRDAAPESYEILPAKVNASRIRFKTPENAPRVLVSAWHGSMEKNPSQKNTTPISNVVFRSVRPDGTLGGVHIIPSALSFLGSLRVGSVWTEGRLLGRLAMATLPATVISFDPGRWTCITAREAGVPDKYRGFGIPPSQYGSWLIQLTAYSGKTLLVPCLEFFIRCYGRSSETSRLIATYGLTAVEKNYFYGHDRDPRTLKLQLRNNISHKEAVFLAHAIYSDFTKRKCAEIHSEARALFSPKDKLFLKAEPWFEGNATIQGDGFWIDDDTFLLLNIDGLSDPEGPPITVERQRYTADEGASGGARYYKKTPPPEASNEEINLIDSEAPDSNYARTVLDPPFAVLGVKRRLVKTKQKIPGKRGATKLGDNRLSLAPGDAFGNGKGGGKSESESPEWMVEGTLQQMWQTCTGLAKLYPQHISQIGWYTLASGLQFEGIPQYQFLSVTSTKTASTPAVKAAKSDVPTTKAVLIIRMTVDYRHIYIVEMYRKPPRKSISNNGESKFIETSYCGLMVQLPTKRDEAHLQLQLIFKNLLKHNGRIKDKTISDYPHVTFIHKPRETGPTPLSKVVLSNLEKLIGPVL
ncbi:hypothetical protein DBR45_00295 [Pseudomonas sp. HMWF031]|nr:hypothetical protein DBR45_00295 [Pseudomonas sp. HMWF031]